MNVLLINMTRFGDLLQMQAGIHELVRAGHTVGVACLENFASAATLLSGVDHVFALPSSALLASVHSCAQADRFIDATEYVAPLSWVTSVVLLERWRKELFLIFLPDTVINLTPTLPARLLSRYLSTESLGFGLDDNGLSYCSNLWASLFFGATLARGVSPFNIVDILSRVMAPESFPAGDRPGNIQIQTPDSQHVNDFLVQLERAAPEESKGFVAFQLGASDERRRWPVASFVRLGALLWETDRLCPVLLGSKGEVALAEEYAATSTAPHIALSGKTSLYGLAAALCCTRILVTNDTGTMHLAAALSVPVMGLFFASAQPFDTGPYMAGSCSVEACLDCHPCAHGSTCSQPDNNCRDRVKSATIHRLCHHFLGTGEWKKYPYSQNATERIWLSSFDANGFMGYLSLSGHDTEDRAVWLACQKFFLLQFLRAMNEEKMFTGFTEMPHVGTLSTASKKLLCAELKDLAALFFLLEEQGAVIQLKAASHMHTKFAATWKQIHWSFSQSSWLGSLAILWLEQSQGEQGDFVETLHIGKSYANLIHAITEMIEASA